MEKLKSVLGRFVGLIILPLIGLLLGIVRVFSKDYFAKVCIYILAQFVVESPKWKVYFEDAVKELKEEMEKRVVK